MTSHKIMKIVERELEALALCHGICIAAVVVASEGEGLTLMTNPLSGHPLALLKATMVL